MRIGLIGWYGHNNAGDDRILFCLRRFFEGHELLVASGLNDVAARLTEFNSCDFILLGGGGLILRGTGWFAEIIERLTPPFGCVGISIEACHPDNLRLLESLKERSEFILVRDRRSRDLMGCHFKTIIGPDLTFLYPYEIAAPTDADVCGLNLRPWKFWQGEHNGIGDRWMRTLNKRMPTLASFYPFARWSPEKAVAILRDCFSNIVPLPLYLEEGVENDRDILSRFFPLVTGKFADDHFDCCRFIISMRLHGLIFACQKGIPFLSLSYQPKNEAFCNDIGLPDNSVSIFDPILLSTAMDKLASNHDELRLRLLDVRADYQREIVAIMAAIGRLVTRF